MGCAMHRDCLRSHPTWRVAREPVYGNVTIWIFFVDIKNAEFFVRQSLSKNRPSFAHKSRSNAPNSGIAIGQRAPKAGAACALNDFVMLNICAVRGTEPGPALRECAQSRTLRAGKGARDLSHGCLGYRIAIVAATSTAPPAPTSGTAVRERYAPLRLRPAQFCAGMGISAPRCPTTRIASAWACATAAGISTSQSRAAR
jgi:hypothetical protein